MKLDPVALRSAVVRAAAVVVVAVAISVATVWVGWRRSIDWPRVSLVFPIVVVVLYLGARRRGS